MVSLDKLLGVKTGDASIDITGLTADSRRITKGHMFAALPGADLDGRKFIPDALRLGAAAILTTPDACAGLKGVTVVTDSNPRRRYAELAARFYRLQPSHQVAVTGTNGKTSVADFTRQLWSLLGYDAASVGTLGVKSEKVKRPGGLTTPDPMELHAILAELARADIQHVALEASSHGLGQHRLDGVNLTAAAFTNLSRDHLDYHKTEQNYFYAKGRLFGEILMPGSTAVLNIDNNWGEVLEDITWGRGLETLTVGWSERAKLKVIDHEVMPSGQIAKIQYQGQERTINLALIGAFQLSNALVAAGLAIATGADAERVFEALEHLVGVAGRMEFVGESARGGKIYIDYAHTPDGLETVLNAALAHMPANLHLVFGCGGDRDQGKRPQMGAIASKRADHIYVTDDNPRSEAPEVIRADILEACPHAQEIGDRASAIEHAINKLGQDDILIIAGKGHEEGQIIGDTTIDYSDIGTVQKILNLREC